MYVLAQWKWNVKYKNLLKTYAHQSLPKLQLHTLHKPKTLRSKNLSKSSKLEVDHTPKRQSPKKKIDKRCIKKTTTQIGL